MPTYTIRVELRGANQSQYNLLYQRLGALGVTDVVASDDGARWRMSPGEYNFEGTADINAVYTSVYNVANGISTDFAVFVSECVRRTWAGLRRA